MLEGWDVKKGDEIASEVIVVVNNVVLSHTAVGIDPEEPPNMRRLSAFEWTQATPQSICSKDAASKNIPAMSVTRHTSHMEISKLKDAAA